MFPNLFPQNLFLFKPFKTVVRLTIRTNDYFYSAFKFWIITNKCKDSLFYVDATTTSKCGAKPRFWAGSSKWNLCDLNLSSLSQIYPWLRMYKIRLPRYNFAKHQRFTKIRKIPCMKETRQRKNRFPGIGSSQIRTILSTTNTNVIKLNKTKA